MAEVEIYIKMSCPFCIKAMALLDELGVEYKRYSLEEYPELREKMLQRSDGRTSVPQIFINGQGVGGCDDLHKLHDQGQLSEMLK